MANGKFNTVTSYFQLKVREFLILRLGAILGEFIVAPRSEGTVEKAKPSARVKRSLNGASWTGVAGGRTVETFLDSVWLLCATLKQRAIQNVEKGPIPDDIKQAEKAAWYAYIAENPEIREAAERLILALPEVKPPSRLTVRISHQDVEAVAQVSQKQGDMSPLFNLLSLVPKDAKLSLKYQGEKDFTPKGTVQEFANSLVEAMKAAKIAKVAQAAQAAEVAEVQPQAVNQ